MRKFIINLILFHLLFIVSLYLTGYWKFLLNFELAFFSSMFIILGSFSGYKLMIERRLAYEGSNEEILDKIEDPYELYDKSDNQPAMEDLSTSELIKAEKQRLKNSKNSVRKTIKSTRGIFSPWRFLPYLMLVLSFIALNNNHILNIPIFLFGLTVGIFIAVILGKIWIKQTH